MNKFRQSFIKRYDKKLYPTSLPFYKIRRIVEEDPLLRIFHNMPKGGNLHIHTGACIDIGKFIDMLLSDREINSKIYIYLGETTNKVIYGTIFYLSERCSYSNYYSLSYAISNRLITIEKMIDLFTISSDRIDKVVNIWDEFHDVMYRISTILNVRIIYNKYYESSFRTLMDDNIDYVELRLLNRSVLVDDNMEDIQKINNVNFKPSEVAFDKTELVQRIFDAYKVVKSERKYMDFKLKVIISGSRNQEVSDVESQIHLTQKWRELRNFKDNGTDFIIGYDLVSEEDHGKRTDEYAEMICKNRFTVPFYFHDGETNWSSNSNLYSAFLLGSKRVGHGINLYNFPNLMELFISNNVALEICPISNQILRYVSDLRMHPYGEYLKRGVQCVICSDDPQLFNYAGLAYDFWETYYALLIDLRAIKKLIKNSYIFSGMLESEKAEKLRAWNSKWNSFVVNSINILESMKLEDI